MIEKAESFNNSFNEEFCVHLEYHLCRTFENSNLPEIEGFWCDGVSWAPYYNSNVNREYLDIAKVLQTKEITTTAHMGKSGQDYYELKLILGTEALRQYEKGLCLIDCLPSEETMDWINLDIENRKIELKLK